MKKPTPKLKPNDIPFGITNAALAFALDLGGVPMSSVPAINRYTETQLFDIGGGKRDEHGKVIRNSRFQGMDIFEAAKAAIAEGKRGSIYYRFNRAKNLEPLCKAFSDQESKLRHGEKINTTEMAMEIARQMSNGEIGQDEGLVRLSCIVLKLYLAFKNQPTHDEVKIDNPGEPKEFEATVQTEKGPRPARGFKMPGFKVCPVRASAELRKSLGV